MIAVYILSILLLFAGAICFRLVHKGKIWTYVFLGMFILGSLLGVIFGFIYGNQLFRHDDPHLGGWIFGVFALACCTAGLTAITWTLNPWISRITLLVTFLLMAAFLVMCIYESKAAFETGIGSKSPTDSSEETSIISLL